MTKIITYPVIMVSALLLLTGCFDPVLEAKHTQVAEGQSQIVVYRTDATKDFQDLQPLVFVNREPAGRCKQGGVFFIDVSPGEHVMVFEALADFSAALDLLKKDKGKKQTLSQKLDKTRGQPLTVTAKPNQRLFVKCTIKVGGVLAPTPVLRPVPEATGREQAKWLNFDGRY